MSKVKTTNYVILVTVIILCELIELILKLCQVSGVTMMILNNTAFVTSNIIF